MDLNTIDKVELRKAVLVLRAVNHELRSSILALLMKEGDLTVTEIYTKLRLEQSLASQHLAILRRAKLVATDRQSRKIIYSIRVERIADINAAIVALVGSSK